MEQYESPLDEARSKALQEVTQFISLTGTFAQIAKQHAQEKRREKALRDQEAREADRKRSRAAIMERRERWAPVFDNAWLARASLLDVARIWGDAVQVAEDPLAQVVVERCEDQLRKIHPHAMGHYDLLRGDGHPPLDAMAKAAPFFARNPNVRTGYPAPHRPAVQAGKNDAKPWAFQPRAPARTADEGRIAESRGRQILERMRRSGRTDSADLRTALLNQTNLAPSLVDRIIAAECDRRPGPAEAPRKASPAARVACDFPNNGQTIVEHPRRFGRDQTSVVRNTRTAPAPGPRRRLS